MRKQHPIIDSTRRLCSLKVKSESNIWEISVNMFDLSNWKILLNFDYFSAMIDLYNFTIVCFL